MTKRGVFFGAGLAVAMALVVALRTRDDGPPPRPAPTSTTSSPPPVVAPVEPAAPTSGTRPPAEAPAPAPPPAPSATAVDLGLAMLEAKKVQAARAALEANNPKLALQEIEAYEKIPERAALKQEAVLIKIAALSKVGRRTDALALGMSTRDDPAFRDYKDRVDAVMKDAGL